MKKSKLNTKSKYRNDQKDSKAIPKLKKKKYFEYDPDEALSNYKNHQKKSGISSELLVDEKLKALRMIVFNALQRNEFGYYERKRLGWILMVMIDFDLPTLGKPKPASWSLWGPVWPITWLLPQALAVWKYQVGKERLGALRECFKSSLNAAFSNNGEHILSFFNYPHWQTTTKKYPELHAHGCVSIIRIPSSVRRKFRGTSPLDAWRKVPHKEKGEGVRQFLKSSAISMSDEDRHRLNKIYKEGLKEIFGKRTLIGEKELVWIGEKPIFAKSERESYSWYLKNNPTSILNKMQKIRYDPAKDQVTFKMKENVLFFDFDHDQSMECTYSLQKFVTRFILMPLHSFWGLRFAGIGGFCGNNHLKEVFHYLSHYPELLFPYSQNAAGIEAVSSETLTQGYLEADEDD